MWHRAVLSISFALVALGTTTFAECPKRKVSPIREILCYTSTFDAQLLTDSVCSCTTLVHQNHDVRNLSISDIADLRQSLKEMHPPLQFVISIYDPVSTLRNSAMVRQEAIARIIAVMKEVDGVEMNMTAGSKERLYNFVKSLKDEMIRKSYDKRIFVSLPSKPEDLAKQFDIKELVKYVDLFTLPTDYLTDQDGAFVTFHPSRLMGLFDMLNTDNLVDLISGLGAPKEKILMTVPANAYKFVLKHEDENAPRSQTTEKEPIPIDRKQLCEAINSGEWTVERDEDLTAPYAFQNKTWIAFEDKISVGIKGKYALLRDLAGLAVRNVENDMRTDCEKPLAQEIYHSFTEFNRKSRQAVLNALEDELHQIQFSYPNQAKMSTYRVVRVVDTEGHIRAVRESTQTEFVCRDQGYFVHPKSCNRFYRCVKFNQEIDDYSVFEFDCPAGLSFDERTEVCVWPGSLPEGSPCPGSSEIAPVARKRFECTQPGYYADPQNCRWFFSCIDLGREELMAFEFRCPYGLVFDEQKLVCEWPWLVPACSESGSAYTRTEYDHRGFTTGTSIGGGIGGYVTGGLPGHSVTAGTGYSGADYSRTPTAGIHGVTSGHAGLSGSIDYSRPVEYGGSASSIPTYTGSSSVHFGSVPSATIAVEGGNTGYSVSGDRINTGGIHGVSTGHAGTGYSTGGINTGYAGTLGGITTGFSGSTGEGYSETVTGSHLTQEDVTYSRTPGSSYLSSTAGGYSGSFSASNPSVDTASYSKTTGTNYFGSTGLPAIDVRIDSTSPKHAGSTNLYSSSGTFNADGYSASTSVHSGTIGHRPSFGQTSPSLGIIHASSYPGSVDGIEITGSTNRGYAGSSTKVYGGSIGTGYPKATSGFDANLPTSSGIGSNFQSSTGSGRVSGTDFFSGTSKSGLDLTSGIFAISGHTGVTTADSDHSISSSTSISGATAASSTGMKYNGQEGYTIPVFVQHEEPIYPSISATGSGVRGHTGAIGTTGINFVGGYEKPDLTRPNLNISIFGNEIPTGYDVQKGSTSTFLTGSSVEGNIRTGDSFSGTVVSHIPGGISSTTNQGAILAGGTRPGYIVTSSGTPGYTISDGLKTIDGGSVSSVSSITLAHGTPTPSISLSGPSTSGIVLNGGIAPGVFSPGISKGDSVQPGIVQSSTGKPYVSQVGTTYHGVSGDGASTKVSVAYSSNTPSGDLRPTGFRGYNTDEGRGTVTFDAAYDIGKYTENDIPDYRPTSATLPDSIVSGGRIEGIGGGSLGSSTLIGVQGSTTVAPELYSPSKSAVFTPSGFTKTGPTRTGITTAILGGGGSYSVSTSELRPNLNPDENISEKAFEGSLSGFTKISFGSNTADISGTLTPPAYSSPTAVPDGRVTVGPTISGYSYPKPTVQFGDSGVTFSSSPISSTADNIPITTPTPFSNVNVFGSKVSTVPADRRLSTPTIAPTVYTTEHPDTYKATLFEAAKIPVTVSSVRPIADTGYKTAATPTNIPVSILTDDRFIHRTGGSQTASVSTSSIDLGVPFQPTDSSDCRDHSSSSPGLGYLPTKLSKPIVVAPTVQYDVSTVTAQSGLPGITYKKPSPAPDVTYKSPSFPSPTTFRPFSQGYYPGQGSSIQSPSGTTLDGGGSPTNLGISRNEINKLITNYDRGTVRYTPNLHDAFTSTGFDSTKKFSSSSSSFTKSSFSAKAVTTPSGSTSMSYEVTTKSSESKGKVIVKWSDLHPLLLGKLGAECTCKADPFAALRGPGKNLIASSKGEVDLANYDESEIYVDLENDRLSEENYYSSNYGDYLPQPYKISPLQTTESPNPSSPSYLPPSAARRSFDTSGLRVDFREGKKLKDIDAPNLLTSVEDDPDLIINGATDCARPGLFRHPSLCNKFYACHWDQWKKKFTLHIFNCPVHLTFDSSASACNWPSKGPACQAGNLLV